MHLILAQSVVYGSARANIKKTFVLMQRFYNLLSLVYKKKHKSRFSLVPIFYFLCKERCITQNSSVVFNVTNFLTHFYDFTLTKRVGFLSIIIICY